MRNRNISSDDTVGVASRTPAVLIRGHRNIFNGGEEGGDSGESVHFMWMRMRWLWKGVLVRVSRRKWD